MNYKAYLDSKWWAAMRTLILHRDKNKCRMCNRRDGLEVHHLNYERVGQERDSDLVTLCDRCHNDIHWQQRMVLAGENMIMQSTPVTIEEFTAKAKMLFHSR